jgi:ankyrin repeat protein
MLLSQTPTTRQRIPNYLTCIREHKKPQKWNNVIDTHTELNPANMCNEAGRTPLHWACAMGYAQLVSLLIEAGGALVNVADIDGASPLHAAVADGSVEVVKYVDQLLQ